MERERRSTIASHFARANRRGCAEEGGKLESCNNDKHSWTRAEGGGGYWSRYSFQEGTAQVVAGP
jgi:hypothetical protein